MGKLGRLWKWLSNPDNRATVALLGGAAVTLIGGAWALYLHFYKPPAEIKPAVTGVLKYIEIPLSRICMPGVLPSGVSVSGIS